jgi:transcriptional regulator with XRE-family HTH domain/Zn-dependent peptidase ImmA (M78 family)
MMIGQRLRQLRLARGLSLEDLSAAIGGIVTKQALSKYEKGKAQPSPVVLNKMASALGVKSAYLLTEPFVRIEFIAYRKGSGLLKRDQQKVESLVRHSLEDRLRLKEIIGQAYGTDLPVKALEIASLEEVEQAAEGLRKVWHLGLDPIASLVGVLEEQSIQVFEIDAGDRFDGISAVAYDDDHRVIAGAVVSRRGIPGERQRLSLAHELGHLMLKIPAEIDEEAAAFRFAGAFLAPAEVVRREVGDRRSLIRADELLLLKRKFGMSAQALLYRFRVLAIIGEAYYKQWCINISKLGWRKKEPAEIPPETPTWLHQSVLRALAEDLISREAAEQMIGQHLDEREPISLIERRAFMKLPLEERRRIMARQAERMIAHYEQDREWREFQEGDFIE